MGIVNIFPLRHWTRDTFQPMLARFQQSIVIAWALSALAWGGFAWWSGHMAWAVLGILSLLFAYMFVLGIEFVLLRFVHREDPLPPASSRQLFLAWYSEVFAALMVFAWRQPFRSTRWPDWLPGSGHGHRGVLLIHGFACNRGIWNAWLRRLRLAGVPMVAVNLEPVFGSIDELTPMVEAAIQRLERCTGLAPVVVAHSMGGLVLRDWMRTHHGGGRVHHAITIATPHRGTWLARFGWAPSARQMRQGSDWLLKLALAGDVAQAGNFTCFYSHCDNIVFPASCATLPGADNRHLPGVAHVAMVDRPEPWQALQHWLTSDAVPAVRP